MSGPRHSQFNRTQVRIIGKIPLLPLKTTFRGPATLITDDQEDIVGETLRLFKANVLFKNFELHGRADILLIYMTLFVSQCLNRIAKTNKTDAVPALNLLAVQQFSMPGDKDFVLGGFVTAPANPEERLTLTKYLTQCRQELVVRLIELVYGTGQLPSKWWMQFAKTKFLNKSLDAQFK